jgi:predicted acylesterase/phospholipase RssA
MKCIVFSGGAEKGISYIGALQFLEEKNIIKDIECYYGTSIGSVISTLISIGYSSFELKYCMNKLKLSELLPIENLDLQNLFEFYGFIEPLKLYKLITLLIEKKTSISNLTFKKHYEFCKKKLYITGSCITNFKCYYFNKDDNPDMLIIDAIKISTSIPFVFQPVIYNDMYYVDGSLYDNYSIFHASKNYNINEILGFLILLDTNQIHNIIDFESFVQGFIKSIDVKFNYLPTHLYKDFTVFINVSKKYNMETDNKIIDEYTNIGYEAMKNYYELNRLRFNKLNIKIDKIDVKDILL